MPCARSPDHPRGCGENNAVKILFGIALGSPPRMRGKLEYGFMPSLYKRITPADAGKTQTGGFTCREGWDHPRGCGENTKKIL